MRQLPFCLILSGLVLSRSLSVVHSEESLLYRARFGEGNNGLDGWTVTSAEKSAIVDPKLGSTLTFGAGGATTPRIPVKGGHRIRFRFTFRKTQDGILYGSVGQFKAGQPLPGFWQLWAQHPAILDPSPVELGLLAEPDCDSIEFRFGSGGPPAQRVSIGGYQVVDLGPLPDYPPDNRELLPDPGWESNAPRTALQAESSYFQGPGWMGWLAAVPLVITRNPTRVHSGQQSLMMRTGSDNSGFRFLPALSTTPDTWYDFSVWAKGEGAIGLYVLLGGAYGDFFTVTNGEVLLAADEWRQLHLPYCEANPAHRGFTVGILGRGRICLDDLSVKQVSANEAMNLRQANAQWAVPGQVPQAVPAGETRSSDTLTLENAHLKADLSPVGGGHIVALEDKDTGAVWKDVSFLNLSFPLQPVRLDWNLPFQTARSSDGREIVFSHTVTGGNAAPFLDGVRIEQVFRLGPDDRRLGVTYRLTNTSAATRLPNPTVVNTWKDSAGIIRLAGTGEEGALVAEKEAVTTRSVGDGWMSASRIADSLVWGFDVPAVQEGRLDPAKRGTEWQYLRLVLPPGGQWETSAWCAPVALTEIDYADESGAVSLGLREQQGQWEFGVKDASFASSARVVHARIMDYGGAPIAAADSIARTRSSFVPPVGRFITQVSFTAGDRTHTVELFNDPRAREPGAHIEGSGQIQYRPTIPARVVRMPEVGDLRASIAKSKAVLWAKGLYFHNYPLEPILVGMGLQVESLDGGGGFPEEIEDLSSYRAVIVSNLGAAQLSPLTRAALTQYVRGGGRLLVVGGSLGLGNALTRGTDFEDLLPATLSGPFEVQHLGGDEQLLRPTKGSGLGALPWTELPRIYWAHHIQPRPPATILATAGANRVLLKWDCGRGKVILFAGTTEGASREGEQPAWNWIGWAGLWGHMVEHLLD